MTSKIVRRSEICFANDGQESIIRGPEEGLENDVILRTSSGLIEWRTKVFGGWIVYHRDMDCGHIVNTTSAFVPDPNHEWEIEYVSHLSGLLSAADRDSIMECVNHCGIGKDAAIRRLNEFPIIEGKMRDAFAARDEARAELQIKTGQYAEDLQRISGELGKLKEIERLMKKHNCKDLQQLENMLETANKAMENQLSKADEKTENPSRGLSLFNWGSK